MKLARLSRLPPLPALRLCGVGHESSLVMRIQAQALWHAAADARCGWRVWARMIAFNQVHAIYLWGFPQKIFQGLTYIYRWTVRSRSRTRITGLYS